MSNDDPIRLKQTRGTSPTLVRALEALRKGGNETARLERVANKLGPLLDAPPNAASLAGGARTKLVALKLIISGLALLAPTLWFVRNGISEKPRASANPSQSLTVVVPAHENAVGEAVVQPRAEPAAVLSEPAERTSESNPAERARRDKGGAARSGGAAAHGRLAGVRPAASTWSAASANPTPAASQVAPAARPAEPSANAPSPAAQTPTVTPPGAANDGATKPALPSEAELLFEARKAMPSDTARALQLLREHEKRYPNGVLVPEREVLAIEALRRLGHKTEADARLAAFQARYPDSLHLERLQR
jgi:hypothetical protein